MEDYPQIDQTLVAANEIIDDDQVQMISEERDVECEFRTGKAGVGKSFQLVEEVAKDPTSMIITATTGIAAVNLGAVTLNSTLGYFNSNSMRDAYLTGQLTRALHVLARRYRKIAIDEGSMLADVQLDILYRACRDVNRYKDVFERPIGIVLVGDFAQLPPVRAKWAFEGVYWNHFAKRITRLTKVWRQAEGPFLDALNLAREGKGGECAEVLTKAGAHWYTSRDPDFDGTTILCKNAMVSRHNELVLDSKPGKKFRVLSRRWGQQQSEWGYNEKTKEWGIPPFLDLKLGAYVMMLSNAPDFRYVNGECGHVVDASPDAVVVRMVRTGKDEPISKIVRGVERLDPPLGFSGPSIARAEDDGRWLAREHFRGRVRKYVTGQIEFYPMRLAWASTVHKSQGLSLDRVQVDIRDRFWASPAMAYVALSRCRTLEGLRIVGQRETFAQYVKNDERVTPWL